MPENDEPLDDLRAVTMTAGAAAARVIETVVRDAQNRAQQHTQNLHDAHRRAEAHAALSAVQPGPGGLPYDSLQRRAATNAAMRQAGVPDEARHAAVTADLLNGADPKVAAATGTANPAKAARNTRTPGRERTR